MSSQPQRVVILLLGVLLSSSQCSLAEPLYFGFDGYSKFSSADEPLVHANESIDFEFKFCQSDGIILYATDIERQLYFAIGVYQSRLLVEFDVGQSLREVRMIMILLHNDYILLFFIHKIRLFQLFQFSKLILGTISH